MKSSATPIKKQNLSKTFSERFINIRENEFLSEQSFEKEVLL